MRGGKSVVLEPHRHQGVFIARGKEDALVTRNMVPGDSVYGEKRISVDVSYLTFCLMFFTSRMYYMYVTCNVLKYAITYVLRIFYV
jgi:hypothetical protein